jgi:hypothetical protein
MNARGAMLGNSDKIASSKDHTFASNVALAIFQDPIPKYPYTRDLHPA